MIGAAHMPKEVLVQMLSRLKDEVPEGKFGVNFLAPFVDPQCVDAAAANAVKSLQPVHVVLLENLRFHGAEEKNDDAFGKQLASCTNVEVAAGRH